MSFYQTGEEVLVKIIRDLSSANASKEEIDDLRQVLADHRIADRIETDDLP